MKNMIAFILLALIVLFAGILRYTGQNWDDFTYSHPDERFLTLNLLPQVGGGNEYTPDERGFPSQKIAIPLDGVNIRNLFDVQSSTIAKIGVVRDSFSHEVATWLTNESQIITFDNTVLATAAIQSYEIDALIVNSTENLVGNVITTASTITSQELQSIRCNHLYPDTNGVGGFFDTHCSNLNPHQAGQGFYTYGTFPLFMAHFASDIVRTQSDAGNPLFDWQGGHLVWRGMSMFFSIFWQCWWYLL